MKHNGTIKKIINCVDKQGIVVGQTQEKQLVVYCKMLLEQNRKTNLVSRTDTEKTLEKNIFSSFLFWSVLLKQAVVSGSRFADLGSGGGFPGVLLSLMMPESSGTLIDSSRKKTLFLKKVCGTLNLNAEVLRKRVEEIVLLEEQRFDFIVALAFAPLNKLILYAQPLLKKGGFILTLKGKNYLDELAGLEQNKFKVAPIRIDNGWCEIFPSLKEKKMLRLEL